jgi:hypothetical protein
LFDAPTLAEMAAVIRREPGKKVKERGLDRILAELESLSDNEVKRFVDH